MSEGPEGVPWEKEEKKLKKLFKGEVLNGYVEAARVRVLTEFIEEKPKDEDVEKELREHPWLTREQAERIVQEHKRLKKTSV